MFVFLIPMFLICLMVVVALSLGMTSDKGDRQLERSQDDDWMLKRNEDDWGWD